MSSACSDFMHNFGLKSNLSILTMGPENLIHQCCANSANGNFMEGGLKPAQRVCVGNGSRVEKSPRVGQAHFLPLTHGAL